MKKILEEKHSSIPDRYSPFIHKLIDVLLEKNPDKRPSIQTILEMPEIKEEVSKIENISPLRS